MSDFEIIKDYDRQTPKRRRNPAVDAVLAGEVVWLPGKGASVAGGFARAAVDGHRITTRTAERDGVKGVYVWRVKR